MAKTPAKKSVALSVETVNKNVGVFRQHGEVAVKHWLAATKSEGMGDCYAALAMAEYMQDFDNIIALEYARKVEKDGTKKLVRQIPFKLSDVNTVRERDDIKQDALAAINKAMFYTVFGLKVDDGTYSKEFVAALKTRVSRAYPAAQALLFRAKELGVKLSDVVTITDDGKVTVADAVTKRVPTKTITVEGKKVEGKPAAKQIEESKPVVLSVKDMGAKAKEWVAPKEAAKGGDTGARPVTGKSSEQKADEAKALAKQSFLGSARNIRERLNSIMQGNNNVLSSEEVDALAVLTEVMGKYENWKAAMIRMSAAGETPANGQKEQAAPKTNGKRKTA